jgi:hypothetical protein
MVLSMLMSTINRLLQHASIVAVVALGVVTLTLVIENLRGLGWIFWGSVWCALRAYLGELTAHMKTQSLDISELRNQSANKKATETLEIRFDKSGGVKRPKSRLLDWLANDPEHR